MKSIFEKHYCNCSNCFVRPLALPASASDVVGSVQNVKNTSSYTVKVKNPATGLERTLNISENGTFRFASLPSGNYDIQF